MEIEFVAGAIALVALLILASVAAGAWMRGWEVAALEDEIRDLEDDAVDAGDERKRILAAWGKHVAALERRFGTVTNGDNPRDVVDGLLRRSEVGSDSSGDPPNA